MKKLNLMFIFVLLTSCTTNHYIEVNLTQPIVNQETQVKESCNKFLLPEINELPPIPKEILMKKNMSDKELILLLTDYLVAIRGSHKESITLINKAYEDYLKLCKKY